MLYNEINIMQVTIMSEKGNHVQYTGHHKQVKAPLVDICRL